LVKDAAKPTAIKDIMLNGDNVIQDSFNELNAEELVPSQTSFSYRFL